MVRRCRRDQSRFAEGQVLMTQQQPAGWYFQPDGSQRFWDGIQWTNQMRQGVGGPPSPVMQPGLGKPKKPWFKRKRVIIPAVAFVGLIAIASQGAANSGPGASASITVATPASPVATAGGATTSCSGAKQSAGHDTGVQ